MKMEPKFQVGDVVTCLKYGSNNSCVIAGNKYTVSEVDKDNMIKLKGHPDWWSPKRFEKTLQGEQKGGEG